MDAGSLVDETTCMAENGVKWFRVSGFINPHMDGFLDGIDVGSSSLLATGIHLDDASEGH